MELVGFLIADTELTQKKIDEVLANILYEASFFGYEQEELKDTLDRIKEAVENIGEGEYVTHIVSDDIDGPEPEIKKTKWELIQAQQNYCMTCRRAEEAKIRQMIQEAT